MSNFLMLDFQSSKTSKVILLLNMGIFPILISCKNKQQNTTGFNFFLTLYKIVFHLIIYPKAKYTKSVFIFTSSFSHQSWFIIIIEFSQSIFWLVYDFDYWRYICIKVWKIMFNYYITFVQIEITFFISLIH